MADEVLLEAGATIDIGPYEAGLAKMVDETAAGAASLKASFQSAAAADVAVSNSVQQMSVQNAAAFANVKTGGILAFDALRAKVIETTAEVARLRAEILETDDAAKLEKLQAQLRRATQEMTAARTELRALRFEAAESKEKLDLMGESLGVKVPGALGTLLARLPLVQTAMAAAFQATIVAFFISMIGEAVEKIGEMATAIGGFGKAAEAAYEKALTANSRMLVRSLELKEEMDKINVIGAEGSVKFARESTNAEEAMKRQSDLLKEENKEYQKANDEVTELQKKVAFGKTWIGTEGIKNYEEELQHAQARLDRITTVVDQLREKLEKRPAEVKTRTAEERVADLDQEIRSETAATEQRKKLADAYVEYFVAGTKRLLTTDQINLETEVENDKAAATQKLENFRIYTAERIAELQKEAAAHPGKNVEPEISGLREGLVAQELATQTKIADLDASFDERRISHANSVSRALAQASKSAIDLEASDEEASARRQLTLRQVSIDQETAFLKDAVSKRIAADRSLLEEELRIAEQSPYKNQDKIIAINQQLLNLRKEQLDKESALDDEAATKKIELARREQEEQLRFTRETANLTLEETRRTDDTRLRAHETTLSQWAAAETAAINRWYSEQRTVLQSEADFAAKTFGQKSLEYQKALNEMRVLDDRFAADNERLNERLAANFQQTMNVISRSWSSAIDRMLTEHTRFNTVMDNFWNQMVAGWARMGIQIVAQYVQSLAQILLQEALTALKIQVIHTQTTSAKIATETLFDSFLNLLGIKRVTKATTDAAAEAGAKKIATATEVATTTTSETAKTLATTTGEAARTGAVTAGTAARTLAVAGGATASIGATIDSNIFQILSDSALAGAAAFTSVIQALPFPENVATAPGVAAATVGEVDSFLALASAATGADVAHAQPVLVHSGEIVTDTQSLNLLGAATKPADVGAAAASAMSVTGDQIMSLQAGHVVVPRAQAAGLATVFSMAGARLSSAVGDTVPFGIKEVPQRLSTSTSATISQIIDRATTTLSEGGSKVMAARDGFLVERSLASAREGSIIDSSSLVSSARDGLVASSSSMISSAREGLVFRSAREGISVERASTSTISSARDGLIISARDGFISDRAISSARDGTVIDRSSSSSIGGVVTFGRESVSSAREGLATNASSMVSSARDGLVVSSAREGLIASRVVLSAHDGLALGATSIFSARDGAAVLSAREGATFISSARDGVAISSLAMATSAKDGLVVRSARDGLVVDRVVSSARDGMFVDHGLISSARDGMFIRQNSVSSSRDGMILGSESVRSAREGLVMSSSSTVSSARDGLVLSARDGFVFDTHVSSARDGVVVGPAAIFSAAEGAVVERASLHFPAASAAVAAAGPALSLPAGLAPPAFAVPAALQSPPPTPGGASPTVTNSYKTVHVRPLINVHQYPGAGGHMSREEIAASVKVGIRRGLIDV